MPDRVGYTLGYTTHRRTRAAAAHLSGSRGPAQVGEVRARQRELQNPHEQQHAVDRPYRLPAILPEPWQDRHREVQDLKFREQQELTCPQAHAMPRLLCFLPSDIPSAGGCVMRMTPTKHTGMAAIVALQGRRSM